jgi:cation transporter-like permease
MYEWTSATLIQSAAGWASNERMSVVNWGTIIPTVVTGVVGLAGISGSIVSARIASKTASKNLEKSIHAKAARIIRAEKRLLYANYLAALTRLREFVALSETSTIESLKGQIEAQKAMWEAGEEVALIATEEIALMALDI